MKKKLAFLMVLGVISLVGCGGEQEKNLETYPSVEAIEPTSAEAEEIVKETEKAIGDTLVIGEVERPLMVTVGENGQLVRVESLEGMIETTSEASESETSESNGTEYNSAQLTENKNVQSEETLSVEQISEIEKSIDEFTDKQAEEWFREVDEANREGGN